MAKLTIDDISDARAYSRERQGLLAEVIALKKRRRISVGPLITFVFENSATIRFQIQEMARVEHLQTDEAIEQELEIYNPIIPDPGELCATMMIELTDDDQLLEWLPKLVGVETMVELRVGCGESGQVLDDTDVAPCVVEAEHARQLTRQDTTASVHYVRFELDDASIQRLGTDPTSLAVAHPAYDHATVLGAANIEELLGDLTQGG